ncbi:Uncharacterised protein [uncultured archaeon]|nr:Uncharacterised protein [uncultured archaeon]
MKAIMFALILSGVLLFGCIGGGVSQSDYDSLKASCDQQKKDLNTALADEQRTTEGVQRQLQGCNSDRETLQTGLDAAQSRIDALTPDAALAAQARNYSLQSAQYSLLRSYYDDAFGPDKIANTVKIKRIEAQLSVVNDPAITASWNAVKNCGGITGCDQAKAAFIGAIDAKISGFAKKIADLFPAG